MDQQWSPMFNWFMELVQFVITFGLTAAITLFGVNKIQEKRARKRNRDEALFQLQMDALREFRRAAVSYEVSALSAYTDLYQWKGGDKTPAMQKYETEAFGDINAALDGIEIRFKDIGNTHSEIQKLLDVHKKRHTIYDTLVDLQLDTQEIKNLWDLANEKRDEFNGLLDEAKNIRKSLIYFVEKIILQEIE